MQHDSLVKEGHRKVVSLEKSRVRLHENVQGEVEPAFAGSRIRYIRGYIEWLVSICLAKHGLDRQAGMILDASQKRVILAINACIPKGGHQGVINQREGLAPELVAELLLFRPNQQTTLGEANMRAIEMP